MQTGEDRTEILMAVQRSNVVQLRGDAEPAGKPKTRPEARQRRTFGKILKMRSGRFQASYVAEGERHLAPVTFYTKTDAAAWLDMRHAELLEHRWKPPAPPKPEETTLREYADRWLDTRRNRMGDPLKPRTKALYRGLLDGVILPELGDYPLPAITPDTIDDWHENLLPDAPTRRAHAYTLLHGIMKSAATSRRRLIDSNPCQVQHATKVDRAGITVPATAAELEAIAAAMPERFRLAVLIAGWAGLRFGELTELRRRDLDVTGKRPVLRVSRAVVWLKGKTIVQTPKSAAGTRILNLPASMRADIAEHLDKFTGPEPDALLFPALSGGHLNSSSLMKPYRKARAAAGRPDLRWHDLRHTHGTLAARAGANLAENMARQGHSTVAASLRYQHAAAARDEEITDNLDRIRKQARKARKNRGGER